MYEAFDAFLAIGTWHSLHRLDEDRFFKALRRVVDDRTFNADNMGAYFTQKLDLNQYPDDHPYNKALDHYVAAASAVKTYLQTPA